MTAPAAPRVLLGQPRPADKLTPKEAVARLARAQRRFELAETEYLAAVADRRTAAAESHDRDGLTWQQIGEPLKMNLSSARTLARGRATTKGKR